MTSCPLNVGNFGVLLLEAENETFSYEINSNEQDHVSCNIAISRATFHVTDIKELKRIVLHMLVMR